MHGRAQAVDYNGVDYNATYAPVVDFEHVRMMLAIAAKENMYVEQVDVKGPFLYGKIDTDVYVRPPKGFEEPGKEDYVWKLNSSIYGLKQAGKIWGCTLANDLTKEGLKNTPACPCIFVHASREMIMLVYVDDGLIFANNKEDVKFAKDVLRKHYQIADLGEASYF